MYWLAWTLSLGLLTPGGEAAKEEKTPSYEAVVQEVLTATEQLAAALAKVQDEASAQAARPELQQAVERLLTARRWASKMPQPKEQERDRLIKQYASKLEDAVTRYYQERRRVARLPETVREVLHELDRLSADRPAPPAPRK
jgi:VIT1/CCC1 family predicted Fe2+/Mn2+ transporter